MLLCFCKGGNIKPDLSKNQWDLSVDCNGMPNCCAVPSDNEELDIWRDYIYLSAALRSVYLQSPWSYSDLNQLQLSQGECFPQLLNEIFCTSG